MLTALVSAVLALTATVQAQGETQCSAGWTAFRDACYLLVDDHDEWSTAEMTCRVFGGSLLTISGQGEQDFVVQMLSSQNGERQVYVGAHDMYTEGNWTWVTGEMMEYSNWAPGEPNDSHHEDCMVLNREDNWQWNDKECDAHLQFICKSSEYTGFPSGIVG